MFTDIGRFAFGENRRILVVPEVRLLKIQNTGKKIGKVDFLLALLDETDNPINFVAVEVQTVYVSGESTRPAFQKFLTTGMFDRNSRRRPDFRSSAQKRLMPQLSLKVPVFRRWGKRFYIAVDDTFFNNLPKLKEVAENSAEITWFVYPIVRNDSGFSMRDPLLVHTQWDDVLSSLREGDAPSADEILGDLRRAQNLLKKSKSKDKVKIKVVRT